MITQQQPHNLRKAGFQDLCKHVQIFHEPTVPGIETHTGQTPMSEEFKKKVLSTRGHQKT
jgi:hypothetical protein